MWINITVQSEDFLSPVCMGNAIVYAVQSNKNKFADLVI